MDHNKEKIENVDLILKQTWLAVSKMYTELAQEHDSTAVQALTLLKIDPKEGTRSTNLGPKMAIEPTSLTRIIKLYQIGNRIREDNLNKKSLTRKGQYTTNFPVQWTKKDRDWAQRCKGCADRLTRPGAQGPVASQSLGQI
ncbi:hypothetical protein [Chryseobacterium cucumeris]|uniref:hypothetical protein n=1 Tax=Chryseobacterium cucumeris TaxID=1813611 RepID=UPI0023F3A7CC|nr:hypothetical protein [Chryseobacterium cucumeris]